MTLAWPLVFIALPLPLLAFFLLPAAKQNESSHLWVPFFSRINSDAGLTQSGLSITRTILFALAWLALVLAATRPQLLGEPVPVSISGRNLIMATDISGSMDEEDIILGNYRVSRIDAVKIIADDFLSKRDGDKVALVVFGSNAYMHTPLSFDIKTIRAQLKDIVTGIAGKRTAIGEAIVLSLKKVRDNKNSNIEDNVLILLTDGENNIDKFPPMEAAKLAAEAKLKIYTIGFAPPPSFFNPSQPDHKLMTRIADLTGGKYYRATNAAELAEIYKQIDKLEPAAGEEELYRPVTELYPWPLAASLIFITLIMLHKSGLFSSKLIRRLS